MGWEKVDAVSKYATNGWFSDLLGESHLPVKHAGSLRAKQLATVGKMIMLMILMTLLNVGAMVICFMNTGLAPFVTLWGAFAALMCAGMVAWRASEVKHAQEPERSQKSVDNLVRGAALFGCLWGIVPIVVMTHHVGFGTGIVVALVCGIVFTGGFLLARVPDAALFFTAPINLGVVIGALMGGTQSEYILAVVALSYQGVMMLSIRLAYQQFLAQHLNAAALEEQSELIGLLLRDFEESTSDVLWQTNAQGVLEELPIIFEGEEHRLDTELLGWKLASVFEAGEARKALEISMMRRQGFRDLVLCRSHNGEQRWWSVTGKPIFDADCFKGFRGVAADITQSKEIEDRIAHMAHYDGLTGLPNRMSMREHLERAVLKPVSPLARRALLWLDLDNFKWVNDTLGHPAGDDLLRQVAARLTEAANDTDIVARISGDEFAMIVEWSCAREVDAWLNDFVATMGVPYEIQGSLANCTMSVGVRLIDATIPNVDVLLKQADLALYQAKHGGKGRWCKFTPELDMQARARIELERDLERALDNSEFDVHFQPVIDAVSGDIVSCETLLRWNHPERGVVFPSDFIDQAEDNGLITRIGEWVIRTAMAEVRRLPDDIRVAINISPLQVYSASLVSTLVTAVAANNIRPERVELEITEELLARDTRFTLERLRQLQNLGIQIVLDDFGTGHSSLACLQLFAFDKIKIDGDFVQDIEHRADSRAIAIATLDLAKNLGVRCTAEGVETHSQAEFLRNHGCDELQGYFISRAQPLDGLQHLLTLKPAEEHHTLPAQEEDMLISAKAS